MATVSINLFATIDSCERHQVVPRQKTLVLYDTERPECVDWDVCLCCNKKMVPENAERLPLNCSTEEFAFLGPSVCLYFTIVKYMLALMCFPLLGSLICAVINYVDTGYEGVPMKSDEDNLFLQECVHFGVWVAAAVYYPFSCLRFLKSSINTLLQKVSAADYTVKVSGIEYLEDPENLRRHLQRLMQEKHEIWPEIDGVFPAYNIESLLVIQKKLNYWETTLKKIINNTYRPSAKRCRKPEMVTEDICQIQLDYYKQLKNRVFEDIHEEEAKVAFVTFRYPYDARRFINSFGVPFFIQLTQFLKRRVCCKGRSTLALHPRLEEMQLTYKRPSQPEDISFENLSIPFSQRLKKQVKTVAIAIGLLVAAGIIFYGFRQVQKDSGGELTLGNAFVSLLISLVILGLNLVLEMVMAIISKGERHPSYTSYKTSVARKLITLMFLNTAVVPTVVSAYMIPDDKQKNWFEETQVWLDVYVIVTVNAIFPPLFYFYMFNPLWWLNRFNKRSLVSSPGNYISSFVQSEANEIYTPLEVDFSERYAQVIKTLYVGLFFSPIVPMSLPLSMLGIAFDYWVTKYMLLRKHPKPKFHNEKLGLEMKEWMRYSLAIYATGVSFFYFKLNGNIATSPKTDAWWHVERLSVVIACVGFVYLCIPINYLIKLKRFNSVVESKVRQNPAYQTPYRQKRLEFETDFERGNPALRRQAQFIFEQDQLCFAAWKRQNEDGTPRFPRRSSLIQQYRNELAARSNQQAEP